MVLSQKSLSFSSSSTSSAFVESLYILLFKFAGGSYLNSVMLLYELNKSSAIPPLPPVAPFVPTKLVFPNKLFPLLKKLLEPCNAFNSEFKLNSLFALFAFSLISASSKILSKSTSTPFIAFLSSSNF